MESHKKHLGFFETKCKTQPDLQEIAMKLPSLNLIPETSKEMDQVLNLTPFQHLWVNIHRVRCFFGKKKRGPENQRLRCSDIFNRKSQHLKSQDPTPRTNVPCTSDLLSSWHDRYADLHGSLPRGEGTVLVASIRDRIDPVFSVGSNDLIFRQICLILDFFWRGLFFRSKTTSSWEILSFWDLLHPKNISWPRPRSSRAAKMLLADSFWVTISLAAFWAAEGTSESSFPPK